MKRYVAVILGALVAEHGFAQLPVPLTRPEMKQALENLKARKPRFDLPAPTEEEIASAGERGISYEGRLRSLYINTGEARGTRGATGFGRDNEPNMTLTYAFKTQLFWVVSRTNNCLY